MDAVTVFEAKSQLSKLLKAAEAGEQVIIERRTPGEAVAQFELRLLATPRPSLIGVLRGQVVYHEDFAAADEEIAELFNGAVSVRGE